MVEHQTSHLGNKNTVYGQIRKFCEDCGYRLYVMFNDDGDVVRYFCPTHKDTKP